MLRKIKIGLVQMRCGEDAGKNLQKAVRGIEETADKGAQIVCLPELFLSPYFCQGPKDRKFFKLAEGIPGPTTEALAKIAREKQLVILCPLFEKLLSQGPKRPRLDGGAKVNQQVPEGLTTGNKGGSFFNSLAVIGTKGEIIGVYHKMHIPSLPPDLYAENYYFEKGDGGFPVFETAFGKIGTMICYDQWFPEGARVAASKGAQILFYPTAIGWPQVDRAELNKAEHEAWQIVQRAHGIENNIFICAVNRVGVEGDLKFWGSSFVSDPYGRVLVQAGADTEENLVVEVNLGVIDAMREEWPFLQERRIKMENYQLD